MITFLYLFYIPLYLYHCFTTDALIVMVLSIGIYCKAWHCQTLNTVPKHNSHNLPNPYYICATFKTSVFKQTELLIRSSQLNSSSTLYHSLSSQSWHSITDRFVQKYDTNKTPTCSIYYKCNFSVVGFLSYTHDINLV